MSRCVQSPEIESLRSAEIQCPRRPEVTHRKSLLYMSLIQLDGGGFELIGVLVSRHGFSSHSPAYRGPVPACPPPRVHARRVPYTRDGRSLSAVAPTYTTGGPHAHYPPINSVAPAHTIDGPHRREYSLDSLDQKCFRSLLVDAVKPIGHDRHACKRLTNLTFQILRFLSERGAFCPSLTAGQCLERNSA